MVEVAQLFGLLCYVAEEGSVVSPAGALVSVKEIPFGSVVS
jgi:hypothetical protein